MKKIRALIVDDSSVMRKIVERSLRQAGIEIEQVYEASHGMEALAVLHDHTPDLIFSDINMPAMDGLQFVRQLRAQQLAPNTPVIMITTEGSEDNVVEAISCGARGYIRKPFTADQIREIVVPLLEGDPQ